jgi:hypothetical protein
MEDENLNKIKDEEIGGTHTPSDEVPDLNSEPKATEEQKEEAKEMVETFNPNPEEKKAEVNPPSPENITPTVAEEKKENPDNAGTEVNEDNGLAEKIEKLFSQEQLNEIVGKTRTETRGRTMQDVYNKYGVADDSELDRIFGLGQRYEVVNDELQKKDTLLNEVMAENALLKSQIARNRWEDAKAILKSKNLAITEDNILGELATHPEWKGEEANKQPLNNPAKEIPSTIERLGEDRRESGSAEAEEARMKRLFGI